MTFVEPDDLDEADETISNFDGEVPESMTSLLRGGRHWVQHCAWNHWGAVWFSDGKFHERVMYYGAHVATISAPTLKELISDVNSIYGHD